MNFNSIIETNSSTPAPAANPASQALGQKDFLRLLTTQLQMQDPSDPVDNKDMLAQMAQFSSLAGLSDINDTLKLILTKLDGASPTTTDPTSATSSTDPAASTDPTTTV